MGTGDLKEKMGQFVKSRVFFQLFEENKNRSSQIRDLLSWRAILEIKRNSKASIELRQPAIREENESRDLLALKGATSQKSVIRGLLGLTLPIQPYGIFLAICSAKRVGVKRSLLDTRLWELPFLPDRSMVKSADTICMRSTYGFWILVVAQLLW